MIARGIAILVGSTVLAAVTHLTVLYTGGYGSAHSYLVIAVAAGVGAASVFYNRALNDERYPLAGAFLVCILSAESFGLYQTANRLAATNEALQAPLRKHAKDYAKAEADVAAAETALASAGTSQRLVKANEAKRKADQAVTDSAKEMGCRAVCKDMLRTAVYNASREVAEARAEIGSNKATKEASLNTAKATLAGMKPPVSLVPLANLTGIAARKLDLSGAILGAIGGNGLACCLLVYGAHSPRRRRRGTQEPLAQEVIQPPPPRSLKTETQPRRPKLLSPQDLAARFALERLNPHGDAAEFTAIRQDYRAWSGTRPETHSEAEFSRALANLFAEAGFTVTQKNGRVVVLGVSLKPRLIAEGSKVTH
jgi:acid phosphatase family membrane protein YuiD